MDYKYLMEDSTMVSESNSNEYIQFRTSEYQNKDVATL
jgi:hypothetical protein